jgi:hypothetical protein
MKTEELNEILKTHKEWGSDSLKGRRADLRGADLGFAQLNLSCKGLDFEIDIKTLKQLMYHIINLAQKSKIDIAKRYGIEDIDNEQEWFNKFQALSNAVIYRELVNKTLAFSKLCPLVI